MRKQIAGELDSDPRRDVAHGRKHRITAVLEFRLAAALEVLNVAAGCEANRNPEANWVRTPSAFSERLQRQGRVEQPIRPNTLVKPFWKNIPMIAIMARRRFANLPANFFCFSAGTLMWAP